MAVAQANAALDMARAETAEWTAKANANAAKLKNTTALNEVAELKAKRAESRAESARFEVGKSHTTANARVKAATDATEAARGQVYIYGML